MTDENTFLMPPAWRRARHPRRDRPDVPKPPALDKGAPEHVRTLVDAVRDDMESVLGLADTAPDIAEAARAHLGGESHPLGAATVAFVAARLNSLPSYRLRDPGRLFIDAWVAEHGIAFAAAAFTEWGGIWTAPEGTRPHGRFSPEELRSMAVGHRPPGDTGSQWWLERKSARTLRARLAAAPDDVYAEAVERLAGARRHELQRLITAYLAPTREDWVEDMLACCGDDVQFRDRWMVLCALGRPHQPAVLDAEFRASKDLDVIASLVDGVGPGPVVPLVADAVDRWRATDAEIRQLLGVLAALPVDEAFQALADRIDGAGRRELPDAVPAVMAAARRFPARAMRLLPGAGASRAAELLSAHVRTHPDVAEQVAPGLPAEQRAAIRAILDETRLPQAADLPPLLAEPPWTRPGRKAEPVVIKDLPLPGARSVAWAPGEREEWGGRLPPYWKRRAEEMTDAEEAAKVVAGTSDKARGEELLLLGGPEDLARPFLKGWEPRRLEEVGEYLPALIARFESDICDPLLSIVTRDPVRSGEWALPLLTDEIARTMADWLVRLKSAGRTARVWFGRHGASAAPSLIPDALGKAGPSRRAAEAALRCIAERDGHAPIVAAARVHGDEAAAAIESLLTADPLDDVPAKIPSFDWVDPRILPQIVLRDRADALPDAAAGHLLTMLAMSGPGDVYAGVRVVRELCDPASLAEFGWALFRWWETSGAPSKENWAFTQLALTGGDETARRLAPVIRAWPGDGGHAKAVTGLDVLAAIGTDTALMHLHGISQRVKFKPLQKRAREKIEELAAELELSAEQLADRLVPDFGLDADGTLTLDYGPRRFVIGFDELLRPTIADEGGKVRKSLPKPGAKDDPELAPAAYKRFSELKKDVRTAASDQLLRLETAMVGGRRWSPAEFGEHLVRHPLVRHMVGRLVWLAEGVDGPVTFFRVAEDGTYADAADDAVALPEEARIGVAHPVHLGDAVKAWSGVFADYEILQPFEQLARPVHTLTDEERATGRPARLQGVNVPVRGLLGLPGLVGRGWERGAPLDAGIETEFHHIAPGCAVVIGLDPGISVDDPYEADEQTLREVRMTSGSAQDLDSVIVSEVLTDLVRLTGNN